MKDPHSDQSGRQFPAPVYFGAGQPHIYGAGFCRESPGHFHFFAGFDFDQKLFHTLAYGGLRPA
jgi:hypothetical protein